MKYLCTTSVVSLERSAFRSSLRVFSRMILTLLSLCVQGILSFLFPAGTLYHLCMVLSCSTRHHTDSGVFVKGVFSN